MKTLSKCGGFLLFYFLFCAWEILYSYVILYHVFLVSKTKIYIQKGASNSDGFYAIQVILSFAIHPKLCGDCSFPQNLHTRKLVEITVFFAVLIKSNLIDLIRFDLVLLKIALIKQMRLNSDKPVGRIFPTSRLIFLGLGFKKTSKNWATFHNVTEVAICGNCVYLQNFHTKKF